MPKFKNEYRIPKVGDIYSRKNYKGILQYWRVTELREEHRVHHKALVGLVTKCLASLTLCTKHGKLYKDWDLVDEYQLDTYYQLVGNQPEEIKAYSEEGVQLGKTKRRIKYLKDMIDQMQEELEELETGLCVNSIC